MDLALVVWVVGVCVCLLVGNKICFGLFTHTHDTRRRCPSKVGWLVSSRLFRKTGNVRVIVGVVFV